MDKRKRNRHILSVFLAGVLTVGIGGCGDTTAKSEAGTEDTVRTGTEDMEESGIASETETTAEETTGSGTTDGVFYWSCEDYYYLLEGKWKAVEYAGTIRDSHDLTTEENYWEEMEVYTNEVIEETLGNRYDLTRENLMYFGPYTDLDIVMDEDQLFSVSRFIPGDYISLMPPYIGLCAQLADTGEYYRFIIDAEETVLIETKYCFFRLEKIEE